MPLLNIKTSCEITYMKGWVIDIMEQKRPSLILTPAAAVLFTPLFYTLPSFQKEKYLPR